MSRYVIPAPAKLDKTAADYPKKTGIVFAPEDTTFILATAIDNFGAIPVRIWGNLYQTSEHAYASAKTLDPEWARKIAVAHDAGLAKYYGRNAPLRDDWEEIKYQVMWDILQAKFAKSAAARKYLRDTIGGRIFEGNTWGDTVWGVVQSEGATGTGKAGTHYGQNALGEMLTEIRGNL